MLAVGLALGILTFFPDRFSADPAGSNVATENREEIGIELGRAVWRIWVRVLRKVCNGTRMLLKNEIIFTEM